MDGILDDFHQAAQRVTYSPPGIAVISGLSGRVATTDELCDAEYWVRQIRHTIRYADGIRTLAALGVTDAEQDTGATVPIGLPGDNTKVYVFDPERRFPGGVGELYITGVQLARGYHRRPDLTREKFVHLADGTRAYRTGDLCRLLPSGELECLGRTDDQIKVLGHRIEPAEIEKLLQDHPAVVRAVVVGRTRPGQHNKTLCAYVLSSAEVTADQLEAHLVKRVPRYMVPARILVVGDLPQTSSGKIDLKALPDPFAGQVAVPCDTAARDGVESAVATIWSRTLRCEPGELTSQTDFYQLGGDSLSFLAMLGEVAGDVVGTERESVLIGGLEQLVRDPTLGRVCDLARRALAARAREDERADVV